MKRLFIALPLEKKFLKRFAKYRDAYGKKTPWLRWMKVDNIHIALLFIGYVEEQNVQIIIESLDKIFIRMNSFYLTFKQISYGPLGNTPRMVWAVFEKSDAFEKLERAIVQILRLFLKRHTERESIPHATLARFKRRVLVKERVKLKRADLEGENMLVSEVLLMESVLRREGPEYKIIKKFDFDQKIGSRT